MKPVFLFFVFPNVRINRPQQGEAGRDGEGLGEGKSTKSVYYEDSKAEKLRILSTRLLPWCSCRWWKPEGRSLGT